MKTILITNDQLLATEAENAGVTRIMVDLESHGKKERQASRNTFISSHAKEDITKIRAVLKSAELIVRINPWHDGSRTEIDYAIAAGADIIMLPMITDMSQLDAFTDAVTGRATTMPLLETKYSMEHVSDIVANKKIAELYIGLNDLHLSLGMDFLFEPLAGGQVDMMAQEIKEQGKVFGFGGIGAIGGGGELPPERILGEHVRIGSTCVILSSRFCKDIKIDEPSGRKKRIADALNALQDNYRKLSKRSLSQQEAGALETRSIIMRLSEDAAKRRQGNT